VQNIEPSPHRRGSAYYAVLRYLLGDWRPYIYRTNDYGRTWTLLTPGTNGIPADYPTRVVREDPDRPGLLYAGTEFGVFISFDDERRWYPFQLNLPRTPVTDMKVHRKDLVLSTQGRSFWILDDLTPIHQMSASAMAGRGHLFRPRAAYRMRYSTGFGGLESERAAAPDEPQYAPPGAVIDYWLTGAPSAPLTLDILDARGRAVRTFSSEAPPPRTAQDSTPGRREDEPGVAPGSERLGAARLPASPGLNRFVWDFAYAGPWDSNAQRSGRNGPLAPPGTYTMRLKSGDWSATQVLEVRIDPRLVRDGVTVADLRAQLEHNLRARDLVSDVNLAVARLQRAKRRLQNGAGPAAADTLRRLNAIEAKLVTPAVRYSTPGLQAHITYLYGMTTRADQRVGRDALERYRVLRRELDGVLTELDGVIGKRS
jgi:hypothetical protein